MTAATNTIDSNITGLRFAEEETLRVLPGTPIWFALEPNSYSDFGGQISTVARNPINPSRQRKKGVTTDLDANGGFNQDLTFGNTTRLMQGFFFADIRQKLATHPMNGAAVPITGVAGNTYTVAAGMPAFAAGDLLYASRFAVAANNGLKTVTAQTGTTAVVSEALAAEAPAATAQLEKVGKQFADGDLSIVMSGNLVRLTSALVDMSALGVQPGEWVYVGGDEDGFKFEANQGFARVGVVHADYLEFDKVSWDPVADAGVDLTVQLFFGNVIKNESAPADIKRRTYQLERTLGEDTDGMMSEYLVGAVPNELTLNIAQADKVTLDLAFVGVDNEQRTGATGLKAGTRPTLLADDAFNTSSDFPRIKLSLVSNVDAAPVPLFAYATELSLSINNNVSPNKAIGTLGAIEATSGTFEVGGSLTAYFADVVAAQAVRNNADVTLDLIMNKNNQALLFDIPLLSLGGGQLAIEQDTSITLPLDTSAAESVFGYTLMFMSFSYVPNAAAGV